MSVLVIVQGTPRPDKAETLKQYQQAAGAVVQRHGGSAVARGSGLESLKGGNQWKVGIVIRFPDLAAVHAWYNDPDYQKVIPLRDEAYDNSLEINVYQE